MPKTYVSLYIHCVFSTKGRLPLIPPDVQRPLWSAMVRIARDHGMKALAVGGTRDHSHALLSLPSTIAVSKAVQLIKGASSKWIKDNFNQCSTFAWQQGYGAFSVHASFIDNNIQYIQKQQAHHAKKSFVQEYTEILERHGIEIDEKHAWD